MRRLDRLITPVVDATKPGDLLIFSPTGFLSSLPLHALRANGGGGSNDNMHLIARNPVVYAPSVSILQICLTRSREVTEPHSRPSVFFSILDDADCEGHVTGLRPQSGSGLRAQTTAPMEAGLRLYSCAPRSSCIYS